MDTEKNSLQKYVLRFLLGTLALIVFFGLFYFSAMYFYTVLMNGLLLAKYEVFVQMEEQVKTAPTVESAVGSMEYAFYYYPEFEVTKYTSIEFLLESLRRDAVSRMIFTLRNRFPETDQGKSPAAWLKKYGNKYNIESVKKTAWYKKWYAFSDVFID